MQPVSLLDGERKAFGPSNGQDKNVPIDIEPGRQPRLPVAVDLLALARREIPRQAVYEDNQDDQPVRIVSSRVAFEVKWASCREGKGGIDPGFARELDDPAARIEVRISPDCWIEEFPPQTHPPETLRRFAPDPGRTHPPRPSARPTHARRPRAPFDSVGQDFDEARAKLGGDHRGVANRAGRPGGPGLDQGLLPGSSGSQQRWRGIERLVTEQAVAHRRGGVIRMDRLIEGYRPPHPAATSTFRLQLLIERSVASSPASC